MAKFTKYLLPLLLVGLTACGDNGSNAINQGSNLTSSVAAPLEAKQKVVLPSIEGISITSNVSEAKARETVRVYVKNFKPENKRVNSITMNGEKLIKESVGVDGTDIFEFSMPVEGNAVIDAVVVDVWAISVDEAIKDYFTLPADVPSFAAAGEVVSFRPASLPGYWFKYVSVVEEGVILTEDAGVYSFTMPAHAVTITAETGANVYAVTAEDTDYYRFSSISNGKTFAVGEEVEFSVFASGFDTVVTKVFVDNTELFKNEETNKYSFVMPAYGVTLTCEYEIVYRTVASVSGTYFDLSLTTVVNGEEVAAENNVLAEQVVYLNVTEKEGLGEHKFIENGFAFEVGSDADNLSSKNLTVKTEAETNRRYFEMPTDSSYVKVKVIEVESEFKGSPLVGSYVGYRPYYSTEQTMSIDSFGNFYASSYDNGPLSKVDDHYEDEDGYKYYTNGTDAILKIVSATRGGTYLYAKRSGLVKPSSTDRSTYSYYVDGVTVQFINAAFSDGSTVSCFVDYVNNTVTWGATSVLINGVDGHTLGDTIGIKNAEGEFINYYVVDKISGNYDGNQHKVVESPKDGFEGTYTGENGNLTLDGFTAATLGEDSGNYVIDNGVCVVTIDDNTFNFVLDVENKTYAASAAPTDGLEGTYTGELGDLVLDGYGVCTLNNVSGTYTSSSNIVTISIAGQEDVVVSLSENTYLTNNPFAGQIYSGEYYDEWDEMYNSMTVTFNEGAQITGKVQIGQPYYWTFTAVYDEATGVITFTVTNEDTSIGTSFVGKTYTATIGDGELTFTSDFNQNAYTFNGATLAKA